MFVQHYTDTFPNETDITKCQVAILRDPPLQNSSMGDEVILERQSSFRVTELRFQRRNFFPNISFHGIFVRRVQRGIPFQRKVASVTPVLKSWNMCESLINGISHIMNVHHQHQK